MNEPNNSLKACEKDEDHVGESFVEHVSHYLAAALYINIRVLLRLAMAS